METQIFSKNQIAQAADCLKNGELVAFPTETVYGLGADCKNPSAVKNVYAAKGRPSDNPLIVHVAKVADVKEFVADLPEKFLVLANAFWPGPLTVILPIKKDALSKEVTGGLSTCAFRMPDNQTTLALIEASQTSLVGPSANTSGKPSPTTAEHVYHDLKGKIAGIVDDGPTKIGVESTVLDLSGEVPLILRPGAITKEVLEEVLKESVFFDKHLVKENETPKAPGMKYKHYAPNAKVYLMPYPAKVADFMKAKASFQKETVGLLAPKDILQHFPNDVQYSLGEKEDGMSYNQHLFAGLRQLDGKVTIILAATLPEKGVSDAYMNRLKKASGNTWWQPFS